MGHFEDRLERKMTNPEFAAGYREAVAEALLEAVSTEISVENGIEISHAMAMTPEVEIDVSWSAPVHHTQVYLAPCP
jgi:hypothetical protein